MPVLDARRSVEARQVDDNGQGGFFIILYRQLSSWFHAGLRPLHTSVQVHAHARTGTLDGHGVATTIAIAESEEEGAQPRRPCL